MLDGRILTANWTYVNCMSVKAKRPLSYVRERFHFPRPSFGDQTAIFIEFIRTTAFGGMANLLSFVRGSKGRFLFRRSGNGGEQASPCGGDIRPSADVLIHLF